MKTRESLRVTFIATICTKCWCSLFGFRRFYLPLYLDISLTEGSHVDFPFDIKPSAFTTKVKPSKLLQFILVRKVTRKRIIMREKK